MAKSLTAPSEAMTDIDELDLFFDTWKKALGPPPTALANGTENWLHGFGAQTKWLTGEGWRWWIEVFQPPRHIDLQRAQNFISLVIGMLGNRTDPQGEAVRYARNVVTYLESEAEGSS